MHYEAYIIISGNKNKQRGTDKVLAWAHTRQYAAQEMKAIKRRYHGSMYIKHATVKYFGILDNFLQGIVTNRYPI